MTVTRPSEWKGSDLRSRTEVVQYLREHGGEVTDQTGLVVGSMMKDLGKGRALSQLLADMEADGMLQRTIRGRRTFSVKLLDDWGLVPPVVVVPDPEPVADGTDYDLLAQSLLAIVLQRASAPPAPARATVPRLEADLAQAELELLELKTERDQLRSERDDLTEQVRILTHNQGVLQSQLDRKPTGPTIQERLSDEEQRLLTELQRSLPERR